MRYFYLTVLIFFLSAIQASEYLNLKQEIQTILENNVGGKKTLQAQGSMKRIQDKMKEDARDKKLAQNKANVLKNVRNHKVEKIPAGDKYAPKLSENIDKKIGREYYLIDPVLNELRKRRRFIDFRRKDYNDDSDSSSLGLPDWKEEWDARWLQKKFEALNSSIIRGDVVNMAAARPWGRQCGDPSQHDMPWGTCMIPAECEPEYRIYRGDSYCGRSMYICCAIIAAKYDTYNALDMSFDGSSFATDTRELNAQNNSGGKDKKTKSEKDKTKRKKERDKRKKKILKNIKNIVKEIRKILNNAYKNGTRERKKKTKTLKKFIESMKKQYKHDREAVVQVHDNDLIKIDESVQAKLDHVKGVNEKFMENATFRDIVVNGTISRNKLKRLLRSHPELAKFFKQRRRNAPKRKRRSGIDLTLALDDGDRVSRSNKLKPKERDYDVEYGLLYY